MKQRTDNPPSRSSNLLAGTKFIIADMAIFQVCIEAAGTEFIFMEEGSDLISVLMEFQVKLEKLNQALKDRYQDLDLSDDELCTLVGVNKTEAVVFTKIIYLTRTSARINIHGGQLC
jgi:hypothetical protein